MSLKLIKDFVSRLDTRDLQSFENDLLQFWNLLNKFDNINTVCRNIEKQYGELNNSVIEFYNKLDASVNKKSAEKVIRDIIKKDSDSKIVLGYFLLREEVKQHIIGYQRVIRYWFPEFKHKINYQAKKSFTKYIVKPFVELIEKQLIKS